MTDDGPLAAKRAEPREQFQRDLGHPGSVLLPVSGSATKRTTEKLVSYPVKQRRNRECKAAKIRITHTFD